MKTVCIWLLIRVAIVLAMVAGLAAQDVNAPAPQPAGIIGTVTDVNNGTVPGATVVLQGPVPNDRRTVVANDKGFFEFLNLQPGVPYHIAVSANEFSNWSSPALTLMPGQYQILTDVKLRVAEAHTTVSVRYSAVEVATEQVKTEEQQRVFGIIPNFYVVYDSHPEPLTTKLKFRLAWKVTIDPVTFAGVAVYAGAGQAADYPDYVQGAKGYGERFGSAYATGVTDIFIGGAILPSLLHQDPRYFYQGTGTKTSRAFHALRSPFVCKGDNGRWQPNISSVGGDLASSAISTLYSPATNSATRTVFEDFVIASGERMAAALVQEFVLKKLTKVKDKK